jgi:guanylate kinase
MPIIIDAVTFPAGPLPFHRLFPLPEGSARRGVCLVLAGPSGAGKTSVAQQLLASDPGLRRSISATTRAPRTGEVDGRDYYFCSQAEFDALVASGGMLEHATVFGRSYGIPRAPVEAALSKGQDVVFVIDWQGHRSLRAALPGDVVGVFLMPPSFDELEARLRARGDKDEDVARRMAEARSEASHRDEFDHVVINDDLDVATEAVRAVLQDAREERMTYKL